MFRRKLRFVRRIRLKKNKLTIMRTVELLTNTNNMDEIGMENNGEKVDWKLMMGRTTLSGKEREFIERKLYETCRNKKIFKSNTNWNSFKKKKVFQKQIIDISKSQPQNTSKSKVDESLKPALSPKNSAVATNKKPNDELALMKPNSILSSDSLISRTSVDLGKQKLSRNGLPEQRNSRVSVGSNSKKHSIINLPEHRNSKMSVGSVGSKKTSVISISEHRRSRASIDYSRRKFKSEQRNSRGSMQSGLKKVPSILVVERSSKLNIDKPKVNTLIMANLKSHSSNESVNSKVTLPVDHNSKSADSTSKTASVTYSRDTKSSSSKSLLNAKRIPAVKKAAPRMYGSHTYRWMAKQDNLKRQSSLSSGRRSKTKSFSSRSSMLEKFEMYTKRVMRNSISRYMFCGSEDKKGIQWIHVPTSWLVDCIKIMDAVNEVVQWSCLDPLFGIVRNNFESIKFDFHDLFPRHRMVSIFERLKPQITNMDSDSSKDESVTSLRSGFSSLYGYHF